MPITTTETRTVILAVANTRTGTADLIGTSAAAGVFAITGANSSAFSILLPTSVSITGPGTAMNITSWVHDAGASPTTDGTGLATLKVGATLTLSANQTAGSYTGNYDVVINYN